MIRALSGITPRQMEHRKHVTRGRVEHHICMNGRTCWCIEIGMWDQKASNGGQRRGSHTWELHFCDARNRSVVRNGLPESSTLQIWGALVWTTRKAHVRRVA